VLGIIGGTGLSTLDGFETTGQQQCITEFAAAPVVVEFAAIAGATVAFLPRHGRSQSVPPHRVNYRANIRALEKLGVSVIVAINAVGGIHKNLGPGAFAVPDQIIDYTANRQSSFFDENIEAVTHIDFTYPYAEHVRQQILTSVAAVNALASSTRTCLDGGVYGCTSGPRLETAAEIRRYKQDGCDMVGMTGMPEAALAREAGIDYGSLAFSVNWAAGLSEQLISLDEIYKIVDAGMGFVNSVLQELASGRA
jgi:5'-methylthioinosine phosphorylase